MSPDDSLLAVQQLTKTFSRPGRRGRSDLAVRAVDDVSFDVARGETFGIVGESGCGKSTLARLIVRLLSPTTGTVEFDGIALQSLGNRQLRGGRRRLQLVFQDATASLDMRMTAQALVEEGLRTHRLGDRREWHERAAQTLERVGI